MSQPRPIVPGATYLITRRVLRRHLLFRPDVAITQLLLYALAVSARRFGIQVHALCAMSTHVHLVVTDVDAKLPRFLQLFHRSVALGTKILRRWEGPVWDHDSTSVVRLWTRTAIVEKIAYTLANPVTAGIVRAAGEWPGAQTRVDDIGRGELRAKRPSFYFNPENPAWPEEEVLPVTLPSLVEPDSAGLFSRDVAAELDRLEGHARSEMRRRGMAFLGAARARAVSPHERAKSFEPLRDRNPTFAVGRNGGGAWRRAAAVVREFRVSYRRALENWRDGIREALFPAGTWWMRVFHHVSVVDAPMLHAGRPG